MENNNSGEHKTNDDRLTDIFSSVGRQYRLTDVTAQFVAFRDLKIRWQRSYKMADFMVSDYLDDAPDGILWDFADTIIAKIFAENDSDYSNSVIEWISSDGFRARKQPIYLRRSKNLTRSPVGREKNLLDSYGRLVDDGLVEEDPGLCISWMKSATARKIGHCSVVMDVVALSGALDDAHVPDFVLDYCLYHELCHVKIGFDPSGRGHDQKFAGLENMYPRRSEAVEWLRRVDMFV